MKKWRNKLEETKKDIKKRTKEIEALRLLKQISINIECKQLQTTINNINLTLNSILVDIFEDPISITINLFKESKTNKKIKSYINLQIFYKGIEYDSINNLSGGEIDRISLALMIALNRNSSSELVMFDEIMTSLDSDLRSRCIRSIRMNIPQEKAVIFINHQDVEGNYDNLITIK